MKIDQTEVEINGIKYVRAESVATSEKAETLDGLPYVIVRTYSAGVFAGYLKSRNGKEVTLLKARRLWYWSGAASLSQLSVDGSSDESSCKFPCEVESIELTEAIEILPCTEKSRLSIKNVIVWEQ